MFENLRNCFTSFDVIPSQQQAANSSNNNKNNIARDLTLFHLLNDNG